MARSIQFSLEGGTNKNKTAAVRFVAQPTSTTKVGTRYRGTRTIRFVEHQPKWKITQSEGHIFNVIILASTTLFPLPPNKQ
ncbi:hypothetical protein QR680_000451 [Steinernema hermaphroditum]|uniref:Uncharacterized protein n=1 Tax=Steinernema hermaphroditum TaxID=289476 RepID=A0AA39GVE2_9BILA|nr:hypothetical protein QR680_000451 [Steinernema hermaphroditum]